MSHFRFDANRSLYSLRWLFSASTIFRSSFAKWPTNYCHLHIRNIFSFLLPLFVSFRFSFFFQLTTNRHLRLKEKKNTKSAEWKTKQQNSNCHKKKPNVTKNKLTKRNRNMYEQFRPLFTGIYGIRWIYTFFFLGKTKYHCMNGHMTSTECSCFVYGEGKRMSNTLIRFTFLWPSVEEKK